MLRRALIAAALALALAGPAAASGKKPEAEKAADRFLRVGGVSAPVPKPGGRRGVLTIDCGLDIADEALRARAGLSQPRLRAAYAQALQIYAAGLAPAEPPDPDHISKLLQRQTDMVLGKPGARLLLGSILIN